jgi:hypothetical protein
MYDHYHKVSIWDNMDTLPATPHDPRIVEPFGACPIELIIRENRYTCGME